MWCERAINESLSFLASSFPERLAFLSILLMGIHVVASKLVITFPPPCHLIPHRFYGQRTTWTARASRAQLAHSSYLRKEPICSWRERLLRVNTDLFGMERRKWENCKLEKLRRMSTKKAQFLTSWISQRSGLK
jgi:hypothetical protein